MRDVHELLAALLGAANEYADTLAGLVQDTADEEPEAHEAYKVELADLESAITEARELLRAKAA